MENKDYGRISWDEVMTNEDIINTAIRLGIENMVNTASVAKVTAVSENKVDVELLNGDKLINLPVCSSGFNGWTVSLPIKENDSGIVIFMKYEISEYKMTGEFKGESLSPFSQNNGLFIPYALYNQPEINDDIIITNEKIKILIDKDGGFTFENEKGSCSFDKDGVFTVSNDGGEITMDAGGSIIIKGSKAVIEADNIELGKNATDPLVLGTKFLTEINKMITMIKTHTHGSNGGGPIPASPDLAAGLNPLPNNILSQTSKTK